VNFNLNGVCDWFLTGYYWWTDEKSFQGGVRAHTPPSQYRFLKGEFKIPGSDTSQMWPVGSSDGTIPWKKVSIYFFFCTDVVVCYVYGIYTMYEQKILVRFQVPIAISCTCWYNWSTNSKGIVSSLVVNRSLLYRLFSMFGETCLGCLFHRNDWQRCFCCFRDCNAFVQVYISWAFRQRSRSCKVLMMHELHFTCTEPFSWIFKANYGSNQHVSLFIFWKPGLMTRQQSSAMEERQWLTLSQVRMRAKWNLKLLMKVVLHSMILFCSILFLIDGLS